MGRQLTCCAIGDRDAWEAICVDLDIAVQGRSFSDVYESLAKAIADYVESAKLEDSDQMARLLKRAVPWQVKLRLEARFLWAWLVGRDSHDSQAAGFTIASPA